MCEDTESRNCCGWVSDGQDICHRAEIDQLREKLLKLKQLILLTDPVVSNEVMNDIALRQWNEFIRCFPDEGDR